MHGCLKVREGEECLLGMCREAFEPWNRPSEAQGEPGPFPRSRSRLVAKPDPGLRFLTPTASRCLGS